MAKTSTNLTKDSLGKQIFLFSLPLMISNVLQVLFNMSDIAVAGRFAGSEALGAVGSTTTLVTLFTGFLIGMGCGVNVLVARYFDARKEKDLEETIHTSAIVCLTSSLLVLLFGILLSHSLLSLLHTKKELIDGAVLYLRIYFLGMPAIALYNFGNAVFSAIGDTKKPLYFLMTAGILNVIMNLFFVIVCNLNVAGVAMASVIPTVIVILGSYVFRVVWVYTIFACFGTITSLYLLYVFSWSITAVAEMLYLTKCYKQQMQNLKFAESA